MDPAALSALKMPKFAGDPEKWEDWSWKFKGFIESHKLLEYLLGTETCPTGTTREEEKAKAEWKAKQSRAYWLLVHHLEGDAVTIIKACATGRADLAWKKLQKKYESGTIARVATLFKRLHTAKMPEDGDVDVFIGEQMDVVRMLADAGNQVDDNAIRSAIVNGLPPSYDTIIVACNVDGSDLEKTLESVANAGPHQLRERQGQAQGDWRKHSGGRRSWCLLHGLPAGQVPPAAYPTQADEEGHTPR
jgi:hypothetical protein